MSKGQTPPYMSLEECVKLSERIYQEGGADMTRDDVAQMMGSTIKSSKFQMKLVAMRAYGLIEPHSKTIKLTNLSLKIVNPPSNDEQKENILKSYNLINLFKSLHEKFRGRFLPEDNFLANTIEHEFGIPKSQKNKWVKVFNKSGLYAGVLRLEGGKVRVLETPYSSKTLKNPILDSEIEANDATDEVYDVTHSKSTPTWAVAGTMPIYLDENRYVTIPSDFDEDDLELFNTIIKAYIKRRAQNK